MIESTIELFEPILTKTSDGIVKKLWGYKNFSLGYWDDTLTWNDSQLWVDGPQSVIVADSQPKTLTEAELKQWGFSTLNANARLIYYLDFDTYFAIGNRARIDAVEICDIKGVNTWPGHTEVIAIPVQGE